MNELDTAQEVLAEPWYHDFSVLGFPTPQKQGIFPANQKAKEGPMFAFIDDALKLSRGTCVELFCADSLFGIYALLHGADRLLGIDTGLSGAGGLPIHLEQARIAADALGVGDRATFANCDVLDLEGTFAIGICAGGLYHLQDPARFLIKLRSNIAGPVVIQTAVSLENTDPAYFEKSPPSRPHGSRFSVGWLKNAVVASGWTILKEHENELVGNAGLEDRGSLYLLCEKAL